MQTEAERAAEERDRQMDTQDRDYDMMLCFQKQKFLDMWSSVFKLLNAFLSTYTEWLLVAIKPVLYLKKKKLKETACLATSNPHPTQKYATRQQTQDLQDCADFLLCILLAKLP